ncbi:MBL fold metallo-hydrolase [Desulfobulbus alkaliphilus]|uniref:MBL fold metallo-hydrolase n=1 Tax=Desulfobulbus alkaliphilus TaxID=869814 RepID=UPI001966A139|nr:MBL fold metallo-hydrolase [Desulfobulbus alkaliphilus]MBM9537272.1 MBL fold metallo-hydrolase [Desulfobulbus alkaliphilus]
MECRMTVLCENSVASPHGLIGEHGWAVHLEAGPHRLLLDTGQGMGLLTNSRVLGIDLRQLDGIVISHGHYDHTSGLPDALNMSGPINVYIHPESFVDRYWLKDDACREIGIRYKKEYLESLGARFQAVTAFTEIFPGIYLTGEVPKVTEFEPPDSTMKIRSADGAWEQDALRDDLSLVVTTDQGLVVLLGCAHAGLINILTHVNAMLPDQPIHTVIGGTHLGFADAAQFEATVAALHQFGVQRLGASHCTGLANAARLQQHLGEHFFFAAAGTQWVC